MLRHTTIAVLVLILASAAGTAADDIEPLHQSANAKVFCGWAISDSTNEQVVGSFRVTRHWLVPGNGCVLPISMFDEGSPSSRDDEVWQTFWVEIPVAPFVGVLDRPRAFSHTFHVSGSPEDTDRPEAVKVLFLARSTSGITAEIELTHLGARFQAKVDFVSGRPYEEDVSNTEPAS